MRTSRKSAGNAGVTASPHSMSVTPSSSISDSPRSVDLAEVIEAVHVDVVHDEVAGVAMDERERRARDRRGDAEPPREPLRERGLADAELADEQDEVASPGERRDHCGGHGPGVLDALAAQRRRRSCGERELGPHEVGSHLRERLGATAERGGRMERRHEDARRRTDRCVPAAW